MDSDGDTLREPLIATEEVENGRPVLAERPFWSLPEGFSISPEMQTYESLNYERSINRHFLRAEREHYVTSRRNGRKFYGYTGVRALRWVVTVLLGILVGLTAAALESLSKYLTTARNQLLNIEGSHSAFSWGHFAAYIAWNAAFVGAAAFVALWWAPSAVGSGIPEVIAYLNGVKIEEVFSIEVYATKLFGTVLCYSSGLMIGPEGPLVHLGACVGSLLTAGNTRLEIGPFPWDRHRQPRFVFQIKSLWLSLCNDLDRRDFITMGAAAGFAAAFGAPVGGVLFAIEEAASFMTPNLMWRLLVCVLVASFSLLLFTQIFSGTITCQEAVLNVFVDYGLINLEGSEEASLYEVPLFIIIGVVGALHGVVFNKLFIMKMEFMKRLPPKKWLKWSIIVAISAATSLVMYALPRILLNADVCRNKNKFVTDDGQSQCEEGTAAEDFWVLFGCDNPTGTDETNVVASMFFGNRAEAIQEFLEKPYHFHSRNFVIMFAVFWVATIASFSTFIPSGIFIPTIMNGCVMGALVGRAAVEVIGTSAHESHEIIQHCALFGAVAFLGGVLRSTVSLCIIINEGTGQTNLLIPIIITTIVSKATANFIQPNSGLYELIIELKNYPHLSRETGSKKASLIRTTDLIRGQNLVTFQKHTTVREVLGKLRSCKHNGFPVVSSRGTLQGLVIREALLLLLEHRMFGDVDASHRRLSGVSIIGAQNELNLRLAASSSPSLLPDPKSETSAFVEQALEETTNAQDQNMRREERRNQDIFAEGFFSEAELDMELQLELVINHGTSVVLSSSPVSQCVLLFTSVGLRHAVVINSLGIVVGIVTRKDLVELDAFEYAVSATGASSSIGSS
jgi:chloride channel 7